MPDPSTLLSLALALMALIALLGLALTVWRRVRGRRGRGRVKWG